MVDCSADVSFQCSALREGGSGPSTAVFFFLQRFSLLSIWGRMYVHLLSPLSHSTPFLFAELVYMIHTGNRVEGIRASSWTRSIHTEKKTIRAVSALRGHRGSCQRPVCSRTVLHVPIMYCQNKEDVQKTSINQRFFFLFSWWMSSTLTLCSYRRWQDNRAISRPGSQHSLKDHPKYLSE